MPVLQEETKKIYLTRFSVDKDGKELPDDEKGWVEVRKKLTVGVVKPILEKGGFNKGNEAAVGIEIIPRLIKDWNLTDAQENKLPVTDENVAMLEMEDFQEISKEIDFVKLSGVKKKK